MSLTQFSEMARGCGALWSLEGEVLAKGPRGRWPRMTGKVRRELVQKALSSPSGQVTHQVGAGTARNPQPAALTCAVLYSAAQPLAVMVTREDPEKARQQTDCATAPTDARIAIAGPTGPPRPMTDAPDVEGTDAGRTGASPTPFCETGADTRLDGGASAPSGNAPGKQIDWGTLCASVPVGLLSFGLMGEGTMTVVQATARARALLAMDPSDQSPSVHPDDMPVLASALRQARAGAQPLDVTFRTRPRGAGSAQVRLQARPATQPDGSALWHGICARAGDLKSTPCNPEDAEARLIRDRMSKAVRFSPAALFEFHAAVDGSISIPFMTDRLLELFGATREDFERNPALTFDRTLDEDKPKVLAERARSSETGTAYQLRFRINHPERGVVWLQSESQPVPQADGSVCFYGATFDITEIIAAEDRANAAERAAAAAEDRLSRAADNNPAVLFEMHRSLGGEVTWPYYNARATEIAGLDPEALNENPRAFREILFDEDVAHYRTALEVSQATLVPVDVRYRVHHPKRGTVWLHNRSKPYRNKDGSTSWYGTAHDVTDQMKAEALARAAQQEAERALSLLSDMTENLPSGLAQMRYDPDGTRHVAYANRRYADLLGVTREALAEGRDSAYRHIHPDDKERVVTTADESLNTHQPISLRYRVQHPERGLIWLLYKAWPSLREDGTLVWNSNNIDITEQVEMESRAKKIARDAAQAHERLRRIADTVPVGLYETRKTDQGAESLHFTSARFDALFGLMHNDPVKKYQAFYHMVHPEDREALRRGALQARVTLKPWQTRFRTIGDDGHLRWFSVMASPHLDERNQPSVVGALTDITHDVQREEELREAHALTEQIRLKNEHQALHDALTGLPNRRYFDQRMARQFANAAQGDIGPRVTLVRIDGDRFKYINDTFGHEAGDAVLQRIGTVLQTETQDFGFPARVGGDEFSILIEPGRTEAECTRLVDRIREGFREPLVFEGNPCKVQASFGIATADARCENQNDLLAFADAALYRAKELGRGGSQLFTPELRQEISDTRRTASDLHGAIERDEFEPYFHVQMDTRTGVLSGVEVLARWNHPVWGTLGADRFLPVADQLRMTTDLDNHLMTKTHKLLRGLRDDGLFVPKISFNVGAGRLQSLDLLQGVRDMMDDGFRVAVELLESMMLETANDTMKWNIDQLRDLGVEIEIDDFGSGHASVLGLLEVRPAVLKIDKRLICHIAEEQASRHLVRALIDIALALDIRTIAEGVETAAQVAVLQELGCFVMQGYHFARPVPARALTGLVQGLVGAAPDGRVSDWGKRPGHPVV